MFDDEVSEDVDLWLASHCKVDQRVIARRSKTQIATSPRISLDRDRAFVCLHQPLKELKVPSFDSAVHREPSRRRDEC